jgi:DNA invertase Pin-like site-specific DNA recombinase
VGAVIDDIERRARGERQSAKTDGKRHSDTRKGKGESRKEEKKKAVAAAVVVKLFVGQTKGPGSGKAIAKVK